MENLQAVMTLQAAQIQCNFEQVEQAIRDKLSEYKDAVFTEDSKQIAKKEVASLRAEQKAFSDNLREKKKEYMAPWEAMEKQAKQLISLYDEPINLINGQVQEFEKKRVAEKQQLIKRTYTETVGDLADFLPLKKVYNPKWENATTRESAIRRELQGIVDTAHQGIAMLQAMESEALPKAMEMFRQSLNVTEAIAYINNYERQRMEILAREQERQRREEAERIRAEERERLLAEQRAQAEKEEAIRRAAEEKEAVLRQAEAERQAAVEQAREEAAQEVVESLTPDIEGETSMWEYTMTLTADAKEKLEMYLDSVGIDYTAEEVEGF